MQRISIVTFAFVVLVTSVFAQQKLTDNVNVFLGSSGDHGQMSPAASYPFSMLSICPQTYPTTHTGYEYYAKKYTGFVHTIMEGVGCQGSGGNILVKPFIENEHEELLKANQTASPGYYRVNFQNGINASFTVNQRTGVHQYNFPGNKNGLKIDLKHTLSNGFVAEQHETGNNFISGWVESYTTCGAGKYRLYYYISFNGNVHFTEKSSHQLLVSPEQKSKRIELRIALSSVSVAYAKNNLSNAPFTSIRKEADLAWESEFSKVKVSGDKERQKLFYSLLYRTMQSPFLVSEQDGYYKASNGAISQSNRKRYNGWAIWDNYHTQLPLLSLLDSVRYQDIITSIEGLYLSGKKNYATAFEPSNTVRTEHAMVVLLDAVRKGYHINFQAIKDSLVQEADLLSMAKPEKALESCYDFWALAELFAINGDTISARKFYTKAKEYKEHWVKEFKDMSKKDVDQMGARGMYQGTVWQYRWLVPYDLKNLITLAGGDSAFTSQLNYFFENDLYNHANETDLHVPALYNATNTPWKSQLLMHAYAIDTVIQYYFNDNSRGIAPFVDRIYKNDPKTYIRTMDDDAGAMSGWFVLTACGISPACVGASVYYLNVPLFPKIKLNNLSINVVSFSNSNPYIGKIILNGKELHRNYLTHQELIKGGTLTIHASAIPVKSHVKEKWVAEIKE